MLLKVSVSMKQDEGRFLNCVVTIPTRLALQTDTVKNQDGLDLWLSTQSISLGHVTIPCKRLVCTTHDPPRSRDANILNIRTFGSLESKKGTNTRDRSCTQKKRFHYFPWNTAGRIIYCHCEISQEGLDPPVFLENSVLHVPSTSPLISSPKLAFKDWVQFGPNIWILLNVFPTGAMPFRKPSSL